MTPFRALHPTILLLATVHLIVDGYSNIYAPLLPLLLPNLGMNLATAGVLTMVFQLAASVAQLPFGHLADRWRPQVLLLGGPVLAVTVLSCVGLSSSVPVLAVLLVGGGLGCAMFHPPAAALAHHLGGTRRGLAMSVHISGGTVGFSFGPLVFAPFVERFGLPWTPLLALPGLLLLTILLANLPATSHAPRTRKPEGLRSLRPHAAPLFLLWVVVVLRTLAALSFATFVPIMLTRRGWSVSEAGSVMTVYLLAGGLGGMFGGPLADRFGPRNVLIVSLVLAAPFLTIAPQLEGWMFVSVLAIGGFFLQSTLPVNVTFAQSIARTSSATVSSLMMGFGWGTGGLSVPLAGMLADRVGIAATLTSVSVMPLIAAACALPLPRRLLHTPAQPIDLAAPGSAS